MQYLRAQQVLQDIFVLDGRRPVIFAVLLDLLVGVLLPEERHLVPRNLASQDLLLACVRERDVYTICVYIDICIRYQVSVIHEKCTDHTHYCLRLPRYHSLTETPRTDRRHRIMVTRECSREERELLSTLPRLLR